MKPNYDFCTAKELEDICEHIDKDRYPERYKEVLKALSTRREKEAIWYGDNHPDDEPFWFPKYRSNRMKIFTSALMILFVAACIFFGKLPYHRMITWEEDPILFWMLMIFFLILGIAQLTTIKSKGDNDT